jgi:putative oxidoreductase
MTMNKFLAGLTPWVLSLLRISTALLFIEHGLVKFIGWPAPSPQGFQVLTQMGAAGAIEVIAGALLIVGYYSRLAALVASGEMAFAYFMAHAPASLYPYVNKGEAAIMFCFIFLTIAVAGGGPVSIDRFLASRANKKTPAAPAKPELIPAS